MGPWRPIAGQDDASYAIFSDRIAQGIWDAPNLLALAFPQCVLGAAFAKLLPWVSSLSVYMLVAFLSYAFNLFLFQSFVRNWWVTISLFIFPVTLQYGLGYLSETFVVTLLLLYLLSVKRWIVERRMDGAIGIIVFSMLIMAQRQTLMVVPLAVIFYLCTIRTIRSAAVPLVGLAASCIVYLLLPKTYIQSHFFPSLFAYWSRDPDFAINVLSRFIQFSYAGGLFVLPVAICYRWSKPTLSLAFGLFAAGVALFTLTPIDPLSAGVLFTNYFPRVIGAAFLGIGAFSFVPVLVQLRQIPLVASLSLLFPWVILCLFIAFTNSGDIKYVLPAVLALAVFLKYNFEKRKFIAYLGVVGIISLFANRYYLDTVEARWTVAAKIERESIDRRLISAGYGRDYYVLGESCLEKIINQIKLAPNEESARVAKQHLFDTIPRYYEDGAVFRYVVKPGKIMGKSVPLKRNVLTGQNSLPAWSYEYRVFGISNSLSIFENSQPVLPWCDRVDKKEQTL